MRELHGQIAEWSTSDYLLANVIDLLSGANWQRSRKGKRPDRFPRPRSAEQERIRHERMQAEMGRMATKHAEWRRQKEAVERGD